MTNSKILPSNVKWWPQSSTCLIVLAILSTIQLFPITSSPFSMVVVCQDFEDLTNNNNHKQGNHQLPSHHNTFQPSSRQAQQSMVNQNVSPGSNSKYSNIIRPILSNRFVPSATGNGFQQLTAQASSSSSVFAGPPLAASLAANVPSALSTNVANQQQSNSVSNIEQLMKNALARTAQMNSATAEPRQDTAASSVSISAAVPPEQAQSSGPVSRQRGEPQQIANVASASQSSLQSAPSSAAATAAAEQSESINSETTQTSTDNEADKTTAAQTVAPNVHDTVYTDQRFANLFARRGNNVKKRITPMEQVKAKPTLPSFIKSLPDPKQFTAVQVQEKPVTQSSFASQRNLQGRVAQPQGSLQKKPVITSNSAAIANNKKVNSVNGKQATGLVNGSATGSKPISSSANLKSNSLVANSRPSVAPSNNNPFNRSQSNNSDPANVIALARKRLLANSALESAKLKQQQQQQQNKPSV